MKPVKVDVVLNSIIKLMNLQAEKKGITIKSDVQKSFPEIMADEIYLDRVFINLLSNAIKYTPDGGEIKVKGQIMDGRIKPHKNMLRYPLLIQALASLRRTSQGSLINTNAQRGAGRIEGTGLGLFIVKSIIDLHDGEVDLKSKVGEGSTFTIKLPLKKPRGLNLVIDKL